MPEGWAIQHCVRCARRRWCLWGVCDHCARMQSGDPDLMEPDA
jgi:hypothetical protein